LNSINYQILGSLGGQVGHSPDFHPDGPGSTPARGNQQKKKKKRIEKIKNHLKNDLRSQGALKNIFF